MEISPEMQKNIRELQESEQHLRVVMTQRYQMEMQAKEAQKALDEIEASKDAEIHKVVGQILIKADSKEVAKELKEKAETLQVRLDTLKKQEDKLKDQMKSLQDRLQGVIPKAGG